eukprot:732935-Ditylum_brightwellii.AAC.1
MDSSTDEADMEYAHNVLLDSIGLNMTEIIKSVYTKQLILLIPKLMMMKSQWLIVKFVLCTT